MAFNITQIINKLIPTKIIDSDLRENPFQTKVGQEVVSVQESFHARLFREGRPKSAMAQGTNATANTITTTAPVSVSPGCELYPIAISVSCDVDAQLLIKIDTQIPDAGLNGIFWEVVYAKAGTPFVRNYTGEVRALEGGSVSIAVLPGTAGKIYGSVYALEVQSNA